MQSDRYYETETIFNEKAARGSDLTIAMFHTFFVTNRNELCKTCVTIHTVDFNLILLIFETQKESEIDLEMAF
jgi:hypothetical protein